MKPSSFGSLLLSLVLIADVFAWSACARRGAIHPRPLVPVTGLVAQGGGPPFIRAAIIRALQARRYTVHAESGQQIIASYERGRHYLQIAVDYEATAFHIQAVEVDGMTERHYDR